MPRKQSVLTTGILAGLAAGLLLPKVAKKLNSWAVSPAGKKTIDEWVSQEDQKQITSLWKSRHVLWNQGVEAVKKLWQAITKSASAPPVSEPTPPVTPKKTARRRATRKKAA